MKNSKEILFRSSAKLVTLFAFFSLLTIPGCDKDAKSNEEVNCEPGEFYMCHYNLCNLNVGARICKKDGKHFGQCFKITDSFQNALIISKGKNKEILEDWFK